MLTCDIEVMLKIFTISSGNLGITAQMTKMCFMGRINVGLRLDTRSWLLLKRGCLGKLAMSGMLSQL